jgi:hypothetical protein
MRAPRNQAEWLRVLFTAIAALALVGIILATRADAATLEGSYTLPTKYVDGTDLPVANIEHVRVEVGTCTAAGEFGTVEGSQLVPPPATTFTITVPRMFGEFCAQAQTETTLANLSEFTLPVKVTKVEPQPEPPVFVTVATTVYEAKIHPTQGLVAGRQVGKAELGTRCYGDEEGRPFAGPDLYRVWLSNVDLSKTPRSELLLAKCEPVG